MKRIEGYTKGPWSILDTAGETIIADRPGEGMFSIASTKNQSPRGNEQRANAELIAAAPETYERCIALEEVLAEFLAWANIGDKSPSVSLRDKAKKLLEEK